MKTENRQGNYCLVRLVIRSQKQTSSNASKYRHNPMMNGNQRKKDPQSSLLPDVQVFLSRPSYPLGGSVVGTILISQPRHDNNNTTKTSYPSLRSVLESVTVYVAGHCRIDSRWHSLANYTKIYGKMHPYLQLLQERFDTDLISQSEDTVCFWATNGMEVLDLTERIEGGRWNNDDLQRGLHEDDDCDDDNNNENCSNKEKEDDDNDENNNDDNFKDDILAFTFRAEIPPNLPHSVHATTCRYFYTANILVKTATQQQILKRTFQVYTKNNNSYYNNTTNNNNDNNNQQHQQEDDYYPNTISSARVKFGNCLGMAHSNGLPCHISATEIHRPKDQMMVVQNHCLRRQQRSNDVQTLRVSNAAGRPVCVLTVIGSQSLSPGSRIHLQWDFPSTENYYHHQQQHQTEENDSKKKNNYWIPCHQVCACLQGEEYAVYEDGSKKRTQSFLFDTCHEYVDPGITDRVSTTLWLSSSGDNNNNNSTPPCDLKTDVMEVSTWCQVDITVRENENENNNVNNKGGGGGGEGGYNNLSLRIPCRIRHTNSNLDDQEEQEMMQDNYVQPLNELLNNNNNVEGGGENQEIYANYDIQTTLFPTNDILSDLKTVSLDMEERVRKIKELSTIQLIKESAALSNNK